MGRPGTGRILGRGDAHLIGGRALAELDARADDERALGQQVAQVRRLAGRRDDTVTAGQSRQIG